MPGQRSIYVRAEDEALWQRALAYAKSRRIPMSALIMTALEEYLQKHLSKSGGPDGTPE